MKRSHVEFIQQIQTLSHLIWRTCSLFYTCQNSIYNSFANLHSVYVSKLYDILMTSDLRKEHQIIVFIKCNSKKYNVKIIGKMFKNTISCLKHYVEKLRISFLNYNLYWIPKHENHGKNTWNAIIKPTISHETKKYIILYIFS